MGIKIPQYGHEMPIQTTRPPIRKKPKPSTGRMILQGISSLAHGGASFIKSFVDDEITSARVDTLAGVNDLMANISTDPDYPTHLDTFEKELSKITGKQSKGFRFNESKNSYNSWVEKNSELWRNQVSRNMELLGEEHQRVHYFNELDTLEKLGDKQELEFRYNVALKQEGITTPAEIDKDRLERFYRIDYREAEKKALSILDTEGPVEAVKYIYSLDNITYDDVLKLRGSIGSEWNIIQAEKAKKYELAIKELQGEFVQKFAKNDMGELKELRVKVLDSKLPDTGEYSKYWWVDKIDKKIKSYLDAQSKGIDDPSEVTDPQVYRAATGMIYDADKDLPATEKYIMENLGNGLSSPDAQSLMKQARTQEKSYAVETALDTFETCLDNGIITPAQYVNVVKRFNDEVSKGEYTEDGIFTLAENELVKISKEYLKQAADKNLLWGRGRATEKYIEEHPPEKKKVKIKEGSATDFESYFNKKPVQTHTYENGEEAHTIDGEIWYRKINGVWHKSNPKTNKYEPYKRSRK